MGHSNKKKELYVFLTQILFAYKLFCIQCFCALFKKELAYTTFYIFSFYKNEEMRAFFDPQKKALE